MPNSNDYQRDVAGRFNQASRNMTFDLVHRLFPELAAQITEVTERVVEERGLQEENVEVILHWFRSDEDAKWLDDFWQSPDGKRFMELSIELMMRSDFRQNHPEVSLPPPGSS